VLIQHCVADDAVMLCLHDEVSLSVKLVLSILQWFICFKCSTNKTKTTFYVFN